MANQIREHSLRTSTAADGVTTAVKDPWTLSKRASSQKNIEVVRRIYAKWANEALRDPDFFWRIEALDFIPSFDKVIVPVRLHFRTNGQVISARSADVWTLRDGKITGHRACETVAEAFDAAGLPE